MWQQDSVTLPAVVWAHRHSPGTLALCWNAGSSQTNTMKDEKITHILASCPVSSLSQVQTGLLLGVHMLSERRRAAHLSAAHMHVGIEQ